MTAEGNSLFKPRMSTETFERFSAYIQSELGIKMGPNKQVMLQSRLMKRLRSLGIGTYEEYYDYLFSDEGHQNEIPYFVHQVTTNKTDFFREPAHFSYLKEHALPLLMLENRYNRQKPLQVWSAACSTGEEVYTLAMILSEYDQLREALEYHVIGSDISPEVLKKAAEGIYEEAKIQPIPEVMKKKYLMRSRDKTKKLVRIVPELRAKTSFKWFNLRAESDRMKRKVDVIFCRNVIIYFERSTQEQVIGRLCNHLFSGGYLFMGHSETLGGFRLPLRQVATTVYRKI